MRLTGSAGSANSWRNLAAVIRESGMIFFQGFMSDVVLAGGFLVCRGRL